MFFLRKKQIEDAETIEIMANNQKKQGGYSCPPCDIVP